MHSKRKEPCRELASLEIAKYCKHYMKYDYVTLRDRAAHFGWNDEDGKLRNTGLPIATAGYAVRRKLCFEFFSNIVLPVNEWEITSHKN